MMSLFSRGALRVRVRAVAAAFGCIGGLLAVTSAAHAQAVYPSADDAANAFVDAIARSDDPALRHVLGSDFRRFIPTGDIGEDDIYQFLGAWSKGHQIVEDPASGDAHATAHLAVGDSGWTLPIPLVQTAHGWRFDPPAARNEMLTRRIGRNERAAIMSTLAYVDSQNDYYNLMQHYAQRFVSTRGQRDGLYWPTAPGETESPLGPLAATMPNGTLPKEAYHGYHYRILTAQGPHAKGGAQNYLRDGVLIGGFGLIASPAEYGRTGVMSFIVNQDGVVYQKNLGAQTARAAAAVKAFDPDESWQAVQP